jgi:hypothetical protein
MATTSGTQPSAPKPGLGDLEKELVCSVCILKFGEFFVVYCLRCRYGGEDGWVTAFRSFANNMINWIDLYRAPIPAFDSSRLPSYLLRFVSQRMVLMASGSIAIVRFGVTIHVPSMSGCCPCNETECYGDDVVGYGFGGKP